MARSQSASYADILLDKMREKGLSLRDLANATSHSYEHLRRIARREPSVGARLNEHLCEYLGLDAADMWRRALQEKAQRRVSRQVLSYVQLPPSDRFVQLWSQLRPRDRQRVLDLMERLAEGSGSQKTA